MTRQKASLWTQALHWGAGSRRAWGWGGVVGVYPLSKRHHRRYLVLPPHSLRWSSHCLRKSVPPLLDAHISGPTQVTLLKP